MVDLPLAPWVAFPGSTGRYVDSPHISAYDFPDDWGMTALLAAEDWTPSADRTILGLQNGADGIVVYLTSADRLGVWHGDGVTNRGVLLDLPGLLNRTTHLLRVEWDNATPLVSLFVDGDPVAEDTAVPINTDAGSGATEDLHIGANPGGTTNNWLGGIYYVELRDDVGDVVARHDAADALAAVL